MKILIVGLVLIAVSLSAKFQVFEDGGWRDYGNFTNYQSAQEEVIATTEATVQDLQIVTNGLARERDTARDREAEAVRKGRVAWWTGFVCGILPAISFMLGAIYGGK